jgi:integrase/recombinase XerD
MKSRELEHKYVPKRLLLGVFLSTKEYHYMPKDVEQEKQVASSDAEESASVQSGGSGMPTATVEGAEDEKLSEQVGEPTHALTDQSSISSCALPYKQELQLRGKSNYTVTCFLSDLKMLGDYVGHDIPVGRITKEHLTAWLMKLKFGESKAVTVSNMPVSETSTLETSASETPALETSVPETTVPEVPAHKATTHKPPAPKTMARRMTFLKNFFSWLAAEGIISDDPAATLVLERPLPPLPELLSPDEIKSLLQAASADPRCYCLVYLVLYAGLKKEEIMALRVQHVDLLDPHKPQITVHFEPSTGKQHRERRLVMPAEFTSIFQKYQAAFDISDTLFPCTDRNLNYILARAVEAAGIQKAADGTNRVTLQLLRDIFAVQQLQDGTSFDTLREKLGLSNEAWLETREKYRRLAFPKLPSVVSTLLAGQ